MVIQKQKDDIIIVRLHGRGDEISDELKKVNEDMSDSADADVIVDFSNIEIINSSNISNLLILKNLLEKNGHRLILCEVQTITKCIFVVAGLANIFEFTDSREDAQETLKQTVNK